MSDCKWIQERKKSEQTEETHSFLFVCLFILDAPMACGSYWSGDQTHATIVTRATAVTTLDP